MAREVQYRPLPYARSGSTLAQLLLRQGEQQAEAERRRGDISAQMWSNVGQQIGQGLTSYAQERQAADAEARKRQEAEDQRKQLSRQDAAFMGLFDLFPDGNVPPKEIMAVYGPERGMAVAQGLEAFKRIGSQDENEQRMALGRTALGMKALSPELQAQMWPGVRQSVIQAGIVDESMLPEEFAPQILDATIAWSTGQLPAQPEPEKPLTVSPGQRVIDPRTGEEIYAAPPTPQRPVSVGSGGRLVDPETGRVIFTAPSAPPAPPTQRFAPRPVMVDGREVVANYDATTGQYFDPDTGERLSGIGSPPTADMRNKREGRKLVRTSIDTIENLSKEILTAVGPRQRAEAIKRGAESVFGNDPTFRTYQDARMALAGNLAVAQQGSRPSDADIRLIWLPLVPDPYRDTQESAEMKWRVIREMSNVSDDTDGGEADLVFDPASGQFRRPGGGQ